DYFAFQKGILILILLVGFGRLGLSLAGVPSDLVRWLSLTAMAIIGTAYVGVQVPRTGFGGFKHLLPLLFIQAFIGNLIIVSGIVLGTVSGTENIFSRSEYSMGMSPWQHAGAHMLDGVIVGPLSDGLSAP